MKRVEKIISLILCFLLCFEQSGIAQVAGQLDISGYIGGLRSSFLQDKFRPLHLRYLSYDNQSNSFKLLLDKGDYFKIPNKSQKSKLQTEELKEETKKLMEYFFIGLSLPNESFWVNLRPDSQENIIDEHLAQTEIGRILLEADVQLKKDTARWTSPETKEGKEYWNKLYKRAEELLGYENISIPTLTRPWIVPKEIIIRETPTNAYVYKATLKVMLEEDYLKSPVSMSPSHQNNAVGTGHDLSVNYEFKDERLKELNTYSTQLINELIIPKLTKEVNTAKRYAPLRQVYYSLILAQWFKQRFYGKGGLYSWLINQKNLTGLTSKVPWSKTSYFQEYQKSFKDGEYNIKEPIRTPFGRSVRSYFSGGVAFQGIPEIASAGNVLGSTKRDIPKEVVIGAKIPLLPAEAGGGSLENPGAIKLTIEMPLSEGSLEGRQEIEDDERLPSVTAQLKPSLHTDLALAEEGIKAYRELFRSLPIWLKLKLMFFRATLIISAVYTGVTPEAYIVEGVNEQERTILTAAIERNDNFKVFVNDEGKFSIVNLEAISRVIAANPTYFPSGLQNDKQKLIAYLQDFFANHRLNYQDREKIYGLFSGFPVSAVEKFPLRRNAVKKLKAILNDPVNQARFSFNERRALLNAGRTGWGFRLYSPQQRQGILKQIAGDSLNGREIAILMNEHTVTNNAITFIGFDKNADRWAKELWQIHASAANKTMISKLLSWIETKLRTMLYWIIGDFGQAEISEAAFILSNLERSFARQGITGVSDWQMEDLAQYIYERQIAAGGGAAVELEEKIVREIVGNSLPAEVIKKILGMGDVGMGGLPVNQSVSAKKSFRGRVLLFIFAGILALSPFLISCAQITPRQPISSYQTQKYTADTAYEKELLIAEIHSLVPGNLEKNKNEIKKKIIQLLRIDVYEGLKASEDVRRRYFEEIYSYASYYESLEALEEIKRLVNEFFEAVNEEIKRPKIQKELVNLISTVEINGTTGSNLIKSFYAIKLPYPVVEVLALRLKDTATEKTRDALFEKILKNYAASFWRRIFNSTTQVIVESTLKQISLEILDELQNKFLHLSQDELGIIKRQINKLRYTASIGGNTMYSDFEIAMGYLRDLDQIKSSLAHEIGHNVLEIKGISAHYSLEEKILHELFASIIHRAYQGFCLIEGPPGSVYYLLDHQLAAIDGLYREGHIVDWEKLVRVALDEICKGKLFKEVVQAMFREAGYKGDLKAIRIKGLERDYYVPISKKVAFILSNLKDLFERQGITGVSESQMKDLAQYIYERQIAAGGGAAVELEEKVVREIFGNSLPAEVIKKILGMGDVGMGGLPIEQGKQDEADKEGKCVTGDTMLPVISGNGERVKGNGQIPRIKNRQANSEIEFKPIVEVKAGDYVLSLNEATQQIEPHRINGLLDMGVKPVYKLTTASGRSIRTTANHPYLVKVEGERQERKEDLKPVSQTWTKVSGLKAGDEIAVVLDNLSRTAGSDNCNFVSLHNYQSILKTSKHFSFRQGCQAFNESIWIKRIYAQDNNSFMCPQREPIKTSEISIQGKNNSFFFPAERDNFFITGIFQSHFNSFNNIVTLSTQEFYAASEETMVSKKLHLSNLLERNFFVSEDTSCVMDTCPNISRGKFRITLFDDFFNGQSLLNKLQDHIDRDTCAFNTGFTKADFRVNRDSLFQGILSHCFHLHLKLYHKLIVASSFLLDYVLGRNAYAQTDLETDILWDKIVSIEYAGNEQVYDIEVEGTHNFIGNGIFAHNTYLKGEVSFSSAIAGRKYKQLKKWLAIGLMIILPIVGIYVDVTWHEGRTLKEILYYSQWSYTGGMRTKLNKTMGDLSKERPNMFRIFLGLDRNTLSVSPYRPTSITSEERIYYSIKDFSDIRPLNDMSPYGRYYWSTELLKSLLSFKQGEIIIDGTKYKCNNMLGLSKWRPAAQQGKIRTEVRNGCYLESFGRDENGVYLGTYDVYNFGRTSRQEKLPYYSDFVGNLLDRIGNPMTFYDRYYIPEKDIIKELDYREEIGYRNAEVSEGQIKNIEEELKEFLKRDYGIENLDKQQLHRLAELISEAQWDAQGLEPVHEILLKKLAAEKINDIAGVEISKIIAALAIMGMGGMGGNQSSLSLDLERELTGEEQDLFNKILGYFADNAFSSAEITMLKQLIVKLGKDKLGNVFVKDVYTFNYVCKVIFANWDKFNLLIEKLGEDKVTEAFANKSYWFSEALRLIFANWDKFNQLIEKLGGDKIAKVFIKNSEDFTNALCFIFANWDKFNQLIEKLGGDKIAKAFVKDVSIFGSTLADLSHHWDKFNAVIYQMAEDVLNVLIITPETFPQFKKAFNFLIWKGGVIEKDNYLSFSKLINLLPGHSVTVVFVNFKEYLKALKSLSAVELESQLAFYSLVAKEKGNLSGIIIEGLLEGLSKGIVSREISGKEQNELMAFIEATNSFFVVLYDLYRSRQSDSDKEVLLEKLKQWKQEIAQDGFGYAQIEDVLAVKPGLFEAEQEELLMAVFFLTVPPLDASYTTKESVRPFIKEVLSQYKLEQKKDYRDDIPQEIRGYEQVKEIGVYQRITKEETADYGDELGKWIERLSEEEKREVSKETLAEGVIAFYQGRDDKERVRELVEQYLRHNPEFIQEVKELNSQSEYGRWVKLHELITDKLKHYLEDVLTEIKSKIKPKREIREISHIEGQLAAADLTEQGIRGILGQYSHSALRQIEQTVERSETISAERKDVISRIIGELLRIPEIELTTQGNFIRLIYAEELAKLESQMNRYEFKKTGTTTITYRVVKGLPYIVWGLNAGVCVGQDIDLFKSDNFILVPIFGDDDIVRGVIYFYQDQGKIFLAGIHPDTVFLEDKDVDELLLSAIEVGYEIAGRLGYEGFSIPVSENIHSNRGDMKIAMRRLIKRLGLKAITLDKKVEWQKKPSDYSFAEVWEFDTGVKESLFPKVTQEIPPGMGGTGFDEKVFQGIEAKVNGDKQGETSLNRREREVLLWGLLDRENPQRARIIEVLSKLSQADIEALCQDAAHWAIPGQRMAEVLEEAIGQVEQSNLDKGKCVTGDTMLPVISGYGQIPRTKDRQANSEIEFKPIVEVKAGDYVLSLNEETQQIEPHRINGLLDMGVKPVYKLTTASGRSIRTTANHPYLVKVEGERQERKEDLKPVSQTWTKVSGLKAGDEIACPVGQQEVYGRSLNLEFTDSIAAFFNNRQAAQQIFLGNAADQVSNQSDNFIHAKQINPQQNNPAITADRITQDISEIGIPCNKNKRIFLNQLIDCLVGRGGIRIPDIFNLMAFCLKGNSDASWTIGVNEEFHQFLNSLRNQFLLVSENTGIQDAGLDTFGSKGGKLFFNIFKIHSHSQCFENHMDWSTCAFNTGLAVLNIGMDSNVFLQQFFIEHFLDLRYITYHTSKLLSRLIPRILPDEAEAAEVNSDILWDKIVSIEYAGNEQVYDIEVEGTHNFIGNGIFAHNTYIKDSGQLSEDKAEKSEDSDQETENREQGIEDRQKPSNSEELPVNSEMEKNQVGSGLGVTGTGIDSDQMSMREIQERWEKFVNTAYMYHGTTELLKDNILTRGLDISSKPFDREEIKRFFSINQRFTQLTFSLKNQRQLEVISLTSNQSTAELYAKNPPETINIMLRESKTMMREYEQNSEQGKRLSEEDYRFIESVYHKYKKFKDTHKPLVLKIKIQEAIKEVIRYRLAYSNKTWESILADKRVGKFTAEDILEIYGPSFCLLDFDVFMAYAQKVRHILGQNWEEFIDSLPSLIVSVTDEVEVQHLDPEYIEVVTPEDNQSRDKSETIEGVQLHLSEEQLDKFRQRVKDIVVNKRQSPIECIEELIATLEGIPENAPLVAALRELKQLGDNITDEDIDKIIKKYGLNDAEQVALVLVIQPNNGGGNQLSAPLESERELNNEDQDILKLKEIDQKTASSVEQNINVEILMRRYNSLILHGISVNFVNGDSLMKYGTTFEHRLAALLVFRPSIAVHIGIKDGKELQLWSFAGVILKGGQIYDGSTYDIDTKATSVNRRYRKYGDNSQDNIVDKVSGVMNRVSENQLRVNELCVSDPEVAGVYIEVIEGLSFDLLPPHQKKDYFVWKKIVIEAAKKWGLPIFLLKDGEVYRYKEEAKFEESDRAKIEDILNTKIIFDPRMLDNARAELTNLSTGPYRLINMEPIKQFHNGMRDCIEAAMGTDKENGVRLSNYQINSFTIPEDGEIIMEIPEYDYYMYGVRTPIYFKRAGKLYKIFQYTDQFGESIVTDIKEIDRKRAQHEMYYMQGGDNSHISYIKNRSEFYEQKEGIKQEIMKAEDLLADVVRNIGELSESMNYNQLSGIIFEAIKTVGFLTNDLIPRIKRQIEQLELVRKYQDAEVLKCSFYMYGVAKAAQLLGDSNSRDKALGVATELASIDSLNKICDQWLDEKGNFRKDANIETLLYGEKIGEDVVSQYRIPDVDVRAIDSLEQIEKIDKTIELIDEKIKRKTKQLAGNAVEDLKQKRRGVGIRLDTLHQETLQLEKRGKTLEEELTYLNTKNLMLKIIRGITVRLKGRAGKTDLVKAVDSLSVEISRKRIQIDTFETEQRYLTGAIDRLERAVLSSASVKQLLEATVEQLTVVADKTEKVELPADNTTGWGGGWFNQQLDEVDKLIKENKIEEAREELTRIRNLMQELQSRLAQAKDEKERCKIIDEFEEQHGLGPMDDIAGDLPDALKRTEGLSQAIQAAGISPSDKLAQRSEEIRKHCNKIKQIIEKNNLLGEVEYHLKMLNLKPINKIKQPLKRLFALFNGVAKIVKEACGHDFDLAVYPASGSDISAGFSYARHLVTIDGSDLFKIIGGYNDEELIRHRITSNIEMKLLYGMHGLGQEQDLENYAVELILLGADLDSLNVVEEDGIKIVVEFQINGETFRHSHYRYHIKDKFQQGNEQDEFFEKEIIGLMQDKNVVLLSKAGGENIYGLHKSANVFFALLPAGSIVVTDLINKGREDSELEDLKTPGIIEQLRELQGEVSEEVYLNPPYLKYGYATNLANGLGIFRKKGENISQKADSPDLNTSREQATNPVVSADELTPGGIDFRALPVAGQSLLKTSPSAIGQSMTSGELDNELQQIEKLVNAGIIPSMDRIIQYLRICKKGDFNGEMGKVLFCLADILRLEEERLEPTDSSIRDILTLVESEAPVNEFQLALSKITISAKEPMRIGQ